MTTHHRFHCPACSTTLTDWLEETTRADLIIARSYTAAIIPRGYVVCSDSVEGYTRGFTRGRETRWMVAPLPRAQLAFHADGDRTQGCCGLNYPTGEENLVCATCHADVAIGFEDCMGPHWAAFIPTVGHEVTTRADRVPLDEAISRLDTVLARGSGTLRSSSVGKIPDGVYVECDEPADWEPGTSRMDRISLALDGEQLVVTDSLAPERVFVVATPRAMLIRLICASVTPWGELDCALRWRADEEVRVVHDPLTARVLIASFVGGQPHGIVLPADAWLEAWARLRERVENARGSEILD